MNIRLVVSLIVAWGLVAIECLMAESSSVEPGIPILTIRGTVVMPDGTVAKDAIIEQSSDSYSNDLISATITDGQFEIKTTGTKFNATGHLIRTADGEFQALVRLADHTLRRQLLEPMKVTLTRSKVIRVKITDDGRVVAKCNVELTVSQVYSYLTKTGSDGIAVIKIPESETVTHISAWAGNHRIGGTSSVNARDTDFALEISRGDPVLVRVVDADQKPIANVPLEVYLQGHDQAGRDWSAYRIPPTIQSTNADGEALFRWIPKGGNVTVHPNLLDKTVWRKEKQEDLQTLSDGTRLLKVTPARTKERVLVEGQVDRVTSDVTGLQVILWSLEGEEASFSDVLYARCDAQGRFKARVLPDCNYRVYTNDLDLVSDFWNGVIASSKDGSTQTPMPTLLKAVSVEIRVTQGIDHRPMADAFLSFEVPNNFSGGRHFWGKSDALGRFVVHVAEGDLRIAASYEGWSRKRTIKVVGDAPNVVVFHRRVLEKQTIQGTLVFPDVVGGDIKPMTIRIAGIDENFQPAVTVTSDAQGRFSTEIVAEVISILATSPDNEFFGCGIVAVRKEPIELPVHPTVRYEGLVLDPEGQPLAGANVSLSAKLMDHLGEYPPGANEWEKRSVQLFPDRTAITDDQGRFSFLKTPQQVRLSLQVRGTEESKWNASREVTITPGAAPPRTIVRFQSEQQIAERATASFERLLTMALPDCRLAGTRVLVMIPGRGELAVGFVGTYVINRQTRPEIYSYIPRYFPVNNSSEAPSDIPGQREFFAAHDWSIPEKHSLFLAVLDQDGKEVARTTLKLGDPQAAANEVAKFLNANQTPRRDAMADFEAALAEAKRTNRLVWASVSQTRGKQCFGLLSWFHSNAEVLSKDYVLFKFDDLRDLNGPEVRARLKFEGHGVPYHAILDSDGQERIPGFDPIGNSTNPIANPDAIAQMRKMLETTARTLTSKEIEQLMNSYP